MFVYFLVRYALKEVYLNSHVEEEEAHGLKEAGFPGSVAWQITHLPLSFALLLCGTALKAHFSHLKYEILYDSGGKHGYNMLLGAAITLLLISTQFIRASHHRFIFPLKSWMVRTPVVCLIIVGTFFIKGGLF